MPVPSSSASARALMVLSVGSSRVLQCGTSPHFIVCSTSAASSASCPLRRSPASRPSSWVAEAEGPAALGLAEAAEASASARQTTGACERGAMLKRGTKASRATQSPTARPS